MKRSALILMALLLAGCGGTQSGAAFSAIEEQGEGRSGAVRSAETLSEFVNQIRLRGHEDQFVANGGARFVALGQFTQVSEIASSYWELNEDIGEETEVRLDFGNEDAWLNYYIIDFEVDRVLAKGRGADVSKSLRIEVSLPVGTATSEVEKDFLSPGKKVVFLSEYTNLVEDDLWGIVDTTLLGVVDDDGQVRFLEHDTEGRPLMLPLVALTNERG